MVQYLHQKIFPHTFRLSWWSEMWVCCRTIRKLLSVWSLSMLEEINIFLTNHYQVILFKLLLLHCHLFDFTIKWLLYKRLFDVFGYYTIKYCLKNIIYFVLTHLMLQKLYKVKKTPNLTVTSDIYEPIYQSKHLYPSIYSHIYGEKKWCLDRYTYIISLNNNQNIW